MLTVLAIYFYSYVHMPVLTVILDIKSFKNSGNLHVNNAGEKLGK